MADRYWVHGTGNWSDNTNHWAATSKDDWKDRIQVELGDSKDPTTFQPQFKLMRWDNEVNFSARLVDDTTTPTISTLADKIIYDTPKREVHLYEVPIDENNPEGGYEFEVILKEKPITNVIEFTLVDKDVEYYYQPFLKNVNPDGSFWEENETGRSECPANVGGSYAIYAKTPKTNWTGGKEYKCGKVGHIFRPKIIDSAGTEVWGDLHIENGILSVTIPQDFLDKAIYPVRVDPTFGYTGVGASAQNISNYIKGNSATVGVDGGTAASISAIMYVASGSALGGMALYQYVSASDVGSLYDKVAEQTITNTSSSTFITANVLTGYSLVASTKYYLLMWANSTVTVSGRYDSATAAEYIYKSSTYSSTWPNPLTGESSWTAGRHSIYCTYTAAAGSPSAPFPMHFRV